MIYLLEIASFRRVIIVYKRECDLISIHPFSECSLLITSSKIISFYTYNSSNLLRIEVQGIKLSIPALQWLISHF